MGNVDCGLTFDAEKFFSTSLFSLFSFSPFSSFDTLEIFIIDVVCRLIVDQISSYQYELRTYSH